jgi:dihydrofolate reductase
VIHSKEKYVFSTNESTDGKATFIHSNIKERVLEIKQQPGRNIWLYGGGKLITTFTNLGLIDVYRLAVHPVILGSGKPLFKDIRERIALKLNEVKSSRSGVTMLSYVAINEPH